MGAVKYFHTFFLNPNKIFWRNNCRCDLFKRDNFFLYLYIRIILLVSFDLFEFWWYIYFEKFTIKHCKHRTYAYHLMNCPISIKTLGVNHIIQSRRIKIESFQNLITFILKMIFSTVKDLIWTSLWISNLVLLISQFVIFYYNWKGI